MSGESKRVDYVKWCHSSAETSLADEMFEEIVNEKVQEKTNTRIENIQWNPWRIDMKFQGKDHNIPNAENLQRRENFQN